MPLNSHTRALTHVTPSRSLVTLLALVLVASLTLSIVQAQTDSVDRSESIIIDTGGTFWVSSNRESLQLVEIRGNLSAARFSSPPEYPTDTFSFTAGTQGRYTIRLTFDYPSDYKVTIAIVESGGVRLERAAYYLSAGQLFLTTELEIREPDPAIQTENQSLSQSFGDWTTRFGDAFPLWVKLLYVVLGVQFIAVGYKWIRFENCARERDSRLSRFDRGNLLYLSSEILFKFLLAAFLVIAVTMGGQFILISALRFMFLAQINMLNLWDLFVLGFTAGIAALGYVFKLVLEKSFDLKPLFQD